MIARWIRNTTFAAAIAAGAFAPTAHAAFHTIADGNSTAEFDTSSDDGMYNWTVDGIDHMFQQWFWFRTGNMTNEASVDSLAIDVEGTTDRDFDGFDDTLFVRYQGSTQTTTFDIELSFILTGGTAGSNVSDVAETIAIHNTGRGELDLSFFQYNDADLEGDPSDSSINIIGNPNNTARQSGGGFAIHETVVTPSPTHYEANYFASTYGSLTDGGITTLNDVASVGGPGDFTWTFQWDIVLGSGGSYIISKDKNLAAVPAPGAAALAMVGMSLLGWKKRKAARNAA